MEILLKEYKKLPENIKNRFGELSCFKICYDRDKNISDSMVILITLLAKQCWLDDEYSEASADTYAGYLLDAVYEYGATEEQLRYLDSKDIVEKYNNGYAAEEILKLDTSDMEYEFTTTDGNKYYSVEDGFYVVNEKGIKISEPNPMADPMEEIFDLIKENKILSMPLSTHYNIRCMIKNDIVGDNELEEKYEDAVESYKNFCKKRFITSRDIKRVVKTEEDIELSEYDNWYSDRSRLYKLNFMQNKLTDKDLSKYSYVATISNGIDYYFGNNKYIAINNNFMLKEFDNNNLFLLEELKGEYKFEYLSEKEAKKIADSLTEKYKEGNFDKISKTNLENYLDYENDKELNSFSDKSVLLKLMLRISNENELKDKIKNSKAKLESRKNDEIEL